MLSINWTLIAEIVGLLALIGKGVQFLWKKYDVLYKKIEEKEKEINKLKNEVEELKIHSARQAAVLEMTSNYLKKTMEDGLKNFVDKNSDNGG